MRPIAHFQVTGATIWATDDEGYLWVGTIGGPGAAIGMIQWAVASDLPEGRRKPRDEDAELRREIEERDRRLRDLPPSAGEISLPTT